jgi:hypothetical protein
VNEAVTPVRRKNNEWDGNCVTAHQRIRNYFEVFNRVEPDRLQGAFPFDNDQ